MTARTLYALPGPLNLTPSQLGRYGRFKLTSRTLESVRIELFTDTGADVVDVTNPGDSASWPLLGVRAVHLSASGYPAHVLLESTELPLELDCSPQIGNTLSHPMPVSGGGGGGGGCLYASPWPIPSPLDLFGGYESVGGYVEPVPPYPAVGSVLSGPIQLYGYNFPPGPETFGVRAGVFAAQTMAAEWTWTLPGARHVCSVRMDAFGAGHGLITQLELLADGVSVVAPGGWSVGVPLSLSPVAFGTVWTLRYSFAHGGDYYGGLDLYALVLWGLGL